MTTEKKFTGTIKDDNGFAKKLKAATSDLGDSFATIQELVIYGLEHYNNHSFTGTKLTQLVHAIEGVKGMKVKQLQLFIQEHAPVRWVRLKDGTFGFKNKAQAGPATIPDDNVYWWDQPESNGTRDRTTVSDPIRDVANLLDRLMSKREEGNIAEGREQVIEEIQQAVADILAKYEQLTPAQLKQMSHDRKMREQGEVEEQREAA